MTNQKKPSGDYPVGYGKPPKSGQIKKGERRNPKGRPKGSKNLKTDLLEELGEMMRVRESGKEHRISKQHALIKTQVARALNGNDRAAAKVIDLYLKVVDLEDAAADADLSITEDEREVLEKLGERLRRQAGLGAHDHDGRVIQSWDTASKAGELNDYSVCTTWFKKGDDFYLLDVLRERLDYPHLKKRVIGMAHRFAAHSVLIEDKGSGIQLI
ncbi:MAG: DUF5681 domain-containing protein [Alphaproteobacteria bacterium]